MRTEHGVARTARDHRRDPGRRGELGGLHLALHPAAALRRAGAEGSRAGIRPLADQRRLGGAGRLRVDALDRGQQHEQPRTAEHRDLGGERVVVAEADLVRRRRVVLVHDRNRPDGEERAERATDVDVGPPVGDLGAGEQHLRGTEAVACERLLPRALQPRLAEGRCRLQPGQRAGPGGQTERVEAERDRPRRDHADRRAGPDELRDLGGASARGARGGHALARRRPARSRA